MADPGSYESFLGGWWQKEMPAEPGVYFVCARDAIPGMEFVVLHREGYSERVMPSRKWGGWWWSEPWPGLPLPSKWKD